MLLTAGTVADGAQALALIEGIPAEYLLADKSLPRTRYLTGVCKGRNQACV